MYAGNSQVVDEQRVSFSAAESGSVTDDWERWELAAPIGEQHSVDRCAPIDFSTLTTSCCLSGHCGRSCTL